MQGLNWYWLIKLLHAVVLQCIGLHVTCRWEEGPLLNLFWLCSFRTAELLFVTTRVKEQKLCTLMHYCLLVLQAWVAPMLGTCLSGCQRSTCMCWCTWWQWCTVCRLATWIKLRSTLTRHLCRLRNWRVRLCNQTGRGARVYWFVTCWLFYLFAYGYFNSTACGLVYVVLSEKMIGECWIGKDV